MIRLVLLATLLILASPIIVLADVDQQSPTTAQPVSGRAQGYRMTTERAPIAQGRRKDCGTAGKSAPARKSATTVLSTRQLARIVLPSVVCLTVSDASSKPVALGSGFVVGPNLVATNVHVIRGAYSVVATYMDGHSEPVDGVVAMDMMHDVAVVYTNTARVRPLPIAPPNSAQTGDPVVTVGSPDGLPGSISTGIISALRIVDGCKIIQTTAPISHGSSGGALLDGHGRVLGVTSFTLIDGQNLNFAYSATYLRPLIPAGTPTYETWSQITRLLGNNSDTADGQAPSPATPAPATPPARHLIVGDDVLHGAAGVCIEPDLEADSDGRDLLMNNGITEAVLQTDAELALRSLNIPVVAHGQETPLTIRLVICVATAHPQPSDFVAYSIALSAMEYSVPTRDQSALVFSPVWTRDAIGCGVEERLGRIRDIVKDMVSQFANGYLAANPKTTAHRLPSAKPLAVPRLARR